MPLVAILLCTYNGARFLKEQLDSIDKQEHQNFKIWASDDGSTDSTLDILNTYRTAWGENKLHITSGPQEGFAANFLSLTCNPNIQGDFFAFADQDDIWQADKLSQALSQLQAIPADVPTLYCARTRLIDEANNKTGYSPLYKRRPSFNNALVQSLASGNTMVMNKAARDILCKIGLVNIASHDWWAYIMVNAVGGVVLYDTEPRVLYRQHDQNVLGAPPGWRASSKRIKLLLEGRFKRWNDINIEALQKASELLTPENKAILDAFRKARSGNILTRVTRLLASGVYRQTIVGGLGLMFAAVMGKM
ncbi:MAG: glycosyltransferase family 2 protein [Gammaproteobacteria bacterium]|nr:glycosyltransferase family 2 protein [Gammaproteobacteria bacterium]MBQ0839750.1 glycosyltransferase family 2 protein [Gammaproteobacteria bacterium]